MFLNEHLLLHIKTFSCESSHKYTLTSSGQRQSSDGGVMRNTYEKNMKMYYFVQKWDLWNKTFKNRKIVKKKGMY